MTETTVHTTQNAKDGARMTAVIAALFGKITTTNTPPEFAQPRRKPCIHL